MNYPLVCQAVDLPYPIHTFYPVQQYVMRQVHV